VYLLSVGFGYLKETKSFAVLTLTNT